jgi:DNA-binding MarR family transcriptional regulator
MKQARPRKGLPSDDECRAMSHLCLSANLRRTERLVTRHYDAYLEPSGVSAVQLPILGIVAVAAEPTFRLLADELELDRSTLSRNLSVLERNGMLTIGPSSGPKPGKIALTAKGRNMLRRAHTLWRQAHRALEKALSSEELAAGLTFLRGLRSGARAAR